MAKKPSGRSGIITESKDSVVDILPQKDIIDVMRAAPDRSQPREAQKFGQVLQFPPRPRRQPFPESIVKSGAATDEPVNSLESDGLERYEREEPIDYRQRMLMNIIALMIVVLLIGAGVWIANTIADVGKDQDCVMQARCAAIEVPIPNQHKVLH